jgi:hypothetical protein
MCACALLVFYVDIHPLLLLILFCLWETVVSIRFFVDRVYLSFLRSVCERKTCYVVFVVIPETTRWTLCFLLFPLTVLLSGDTPAVHALAHS